MDEMDGITLLEYIHGRLSREGEERVEAWLDLSPGGEVPGSTAGGAIVPGNSRAFLELSSGEVVPCPTRTGSCRKRTAAASGWPRTER